MNMSKWRSTVGIGLSRLGLLAVVLTLIGGLFGMHTMDVVHAKAMASASMAHPALVLTPVTEGAATERTTTLHSLGQVNLVAGTAMPALQSGPIDCGFSPSDDHASMPGHGTCIPSFGPDFLVLPTPGTLTWIQAPTAFTSAPGPKSMGRVPDPPSLIQLSINRT